MKNCKLKQSYEEIKLNDSDHVATPKWIVENIYDLINIKNFKMCWFPFDNYDSEFKLIADDLKLKYKATHIFDNYNNDFFKVLPPKDCDLMISNPPFSLQNKIIERSFYLIDNSYIKSFCLLLPLSTLETCFRANFWERYQDKLSIIIFKKRVKFLGYKSSFNKACCWIIYNIRNIPKISWI